MLLDRMAQIQTETRVSVVVMLKRIYLPFYRRFFHSESVVVFLSVTNVSSTFLTSKRNASDKNHRLWEVGMASTSRPLILGVFQITYLNTAAAFTEYIQCAYSWDIPLRHDSCILFVMVWIWSQFLRSPFFCVLWTSERFIMLQFFL